MNIRTFVTILSRKAQCNFPKMRGGGQKPFGTFPKIHLILLTLPVPKEGLKKTGLVITEDSRSQWILNGTLWNLRSRLGGKGAKEVSSKFNFNSFVEHYQAYPTAQALFNKMVRLI